MNRDNASLIDIVKAAQRVLAFTTGLAKEELAKNDEKQSAVLYQIIIVGEATKRLSPEFRNRYSIIPWSDIAGMRDILAHQYDKINLNTLWSVIQDDIPELLTLLQPIVTALSEEES